MANDRQQLLKQRMLEYMGGKCVLCGYHRCARALAFHHVNDDTKKFTISGAHCHKWEVLKLELDKCVLVCMNCHGEIHAGLAQLG